MSDTAHTLDRSDRTALHVVAWIALGGFALAITAMLIGIVNAFAAPTLTMPDLPILNGHAPGFAQSADAVASATYSTATLEVTGAPASLRWALAASIFAGSLTSIGITALVFVLGRKIAAERKLLPQLAIGAGGAAVLTFASSLFQPFFAAIAQGELVTWLGLADGAGEAPGGFMFSLDAGILALPAVLLLLSAVLFVVSRLQRETGAVEAVAA